MNIQCFASSVGALNVPSTTFETRHVCNGRSRKGICAQIPLQRSKLRRNGSLVIRCATSSSKPPGSIGNTIKQLRESVQSCLSSQLSRIYIQLPENTEFGLEKQQKQTSKLVQLNAGLSREEIETRELARLVIEMFKGTGLQTVALFNDDKAKNAAEFVYESQGVQDVTTVSVSNVGKVVTSSTDVLICVNPKIKQLVAIRSISEKEGARLGVLLLNPRFETQKFPNPVLEEFYRNEFECAMYYETNPTREAVAVLKPAESVQSKQQDVSRFVLYRQFPYQWTLCQKRGLGPPKEVSTWSSRPSLEEIKQVASAVNNGSGSGGGSGLFGSIQNLFKK